MSITPVDRRRAAPAPPEARRTPVERRSSARRACGRFVGRDRPTRRPDRRTVGAPCHHGRDGSRRLASFPQDRRHATGRGRCCMPARQPRGAPRDDGDRFPGLLRPPPRAHRVLHARRCGETGRARRAHRRAGHARHRDDRPRQRVRRLRVLQEGQGRRGQADHRHRGLLRPEHLPLRAQGRQLLRRRPRRRVGPRRLHPHDAALGDHRGHAQPVPALHRRLARRLLQAAAHGPRAARPARQGHHRHHRLPVGRGPGPPAPRPVRRRPPGRRRLPGHPRQGELLPRADGPRARHREPRPRRPAPAGQGPADPDARHQRLPLRHARGRPVAGAPALHQLRLDDGHPRGRRPGPAVRVLRRRLLHQVARGDARALGRQVRPPRGLRQHAADRRALRRLVHRGQRHLHAALPLPGGGERGLLAGQGGREGPPLPLPERHPRRGAQAGRLRGRRDHPDGLPRLLPRRRRLHQLGQGQRHPGRPRPRLRRRLDGRLRHADHRPRPAGARPDLRALPQPRPRLDARLRHRLRRAPARRGHPLRHREVRRRPGLLHRHLRHHQGEAGRQGLQPDPRLPVRHGRPDHQGDARRR